MEILLICGIVVGAFVIVAYRIVRTLRKPESPCCNCDTCIQPESVRDVCGSDNLQHNKTAAPSDTNDRSPEDGETEER